MRDSKLFHFLKLLDKNGLKRFLDFARSPYFTKREGPPRLVAFLECELRKKNPFNLSEEEVFAQMYPDRPFNHNTFQKLKNHTLDLLLRFFAFEEFAQDDGRDHIYLLRALNRLRENRFFGKYYDSFANADSAPPATSFEYKFHLHMEQNLHKNMHFNRGEAPLLPELIKYVEADHLMRRLRLAAQVENQNRISNQKLPVSAFDDLMQIDAERLENLPPLGRMWHALFMSYREHENAEHYQCLNRLMKEFKDQISKDQQEDLYNGTINYCIRKVNNGFVEYREELLRIYQEMDEGDLLLSQGKISALHVKNIVLLAARIGEFSYADDFLERYGHSIAGVSDSYVTEYNQGVLCFYREMYQDAEIHFNRVMGGIKDAFWNLDARTYLLRIHYETGNAVGMEALAHSFRVYLDRLRSISRERKDNYYTFIKLFRRLCNLPPRDRKRIDRLSVEVQESARIAARDWFLEKIAALSKQFR